MHKDQVIKKRAALEKKLANAELKVVAIRQAMEVLKVQCLHPNGRYDGDSDPRIPSSWWLCPDCKLYRSFGCG